MARQAHRLSRFHRGAFTLVELMVVLVILLIGALAVVPMLSSGASVQVEAAADKLAADLEYAKSLAIGRSQTVRVRFDVAQNYYQIRDVNGVIEHPVTHQPYTVDFDALRHLDRVRLAQVDFDTTTELLFDPLGSPQDAGGNPLNSGRVVLEADDHQRTVTVEPVTGLVRISP